jgi:glycosyltransferase involved in cell wall biosynthesis
VTHASKPAFSIVVPCHNYGHFLGTTLRSVLQQERDDVEVIVVDDASTDDSLDVARSFGDPVRVIALRQNVGPGAAWAEGLRQARGDYLCKLDADDWQLPGFLDRIEHEFMRDERVGLVATAVYLYKDGEDIAVVQSPGKASVFDEAKLRRRLLRKFFVRMPGTALRAEAIEGTDSPRPDLRLAHDWEFFLRALRGWRAALVDEPLAVYRIHGASLTLTAASGRRLETEFLELLASTRDANGGSFLTPNERRSFAVGVSESYLGTIGPHLTFGDWGGALSHGKAALGLASSVSPIDAFRVIPYVAWGAWQRVVGRRRRDHYPLSALLPS